MKPWSEDGHIRLNVLQSAKIVTFECTELWKLGLSRASKAEKRQTQKFSPIAHMNEDMCEHYACTIVKAKWQYVPTYTAI